MNPSLSITPQVALDGSPRPRNSSADWMEMATPAMAAVWMMMGARTTEKMCLAMMRPSDRPETRAASTYSSLRTDCTAERVSRK